MLMGEIRAQIQEIATRFEAVEIELRRIAADFAYSENQIETGVGNCALVCPGSTVVCTDWIVGDRSYNRRSADSNILVEMLSIKTKSESMRKISLRGQRNGGTQTFDISTAC